MTVSNMVVRKMETIIRILLVLFFLLLLSASIVTVFIKISPCFLSKYQLLPSTGISFHRASSLSELQTLFSIDSSFRCTSSLSELQTLFSIGTSLRCASLQKIGYPSVFYNQNPFCRLCYFFIMRNHNNCLTILFRRHFQQRYHFSA